MRSNACVVVCIKVMECDRVDLLEEVRKSKVKDEKVVKAVEEMKRAGVKMLRDEEWRECYKLHSVISLPNLERFLWSQGQLKALKETF